MRPNLASWRINWQTRRARSVLSPSIPLRRGVLNTVSRIGLLLFLSFANLLSFSPLSWSRDEESCCSSRTLGRVCINIRMICHFIFFPRSCESYCIRVWDSFKIRNRYNSEDLSRLSYTLWIHLFRDISRIDKFFEFFLFFVTQIPRLLKYRRNNLRVRICFFSSITQLNIWTTF